MSRLGKVFGYEKGSRHYYLDLALMTVAVVAAIWTIGAVAHHSGKFDLGLGIGAAVVALAAILLTSDRLLTVGVILGYIVIRGVIGYAETGEIGVLPWIAAAAAAFVVVWKISARITGRRPR